jgi:pyruvate/2-oxoglutarate dehydrogenase complex dihydrolipoamide dehydrogenase (E3) component
MEYDYDLAVIGGGAAGLTASGIGANLAAKTLMIERERLGGDCTWYGCVPSKTLLHAARLAHDARQASAFGVRADVTVDFGAVMEKVRAVREHVYHEADAPERFEAMGVEVAGGEARFVNPHTLDIEGAGGRVRRVTARKIIVATGGRARAPDLPGLDRVQHLTNHNVFELKQLPQRLAILGAGPIGTELAQAFSRLGSQVTVVETGERILAHDDAELASALHDVLKGEGIAYRMGATAVRVEPDGDGLRLILDAGEPVRADALLTSVGRLPNVEGLDLEAAGVAYDEKGIPVDASCRTNVGHIWAVGDVTPGPDFTHMSEHQAKTAATNALLKLPVKQDDTIPWVTFTAPELAQVGPTEEQLRERGVGFETYRFPYDKLDRAITEGATTGLVKVHARALDGKIYGASILGERAGEIASLYAVAIASGTTLRTISDTIFPYPAWGQAARRAADQWYARKQSEGLVRFVKTVFGYDGEVQQVDPDRIV